MMLNLAGVVSGKALARHRPWIVIGTVVFAAVATPSTDPFSMLFLAVPMLVLFGDRGGHRPARRSVVAGWVTDSRRRRTTRRRRCDDGVVTTLDAFDLPDWLGEGEVTWTSDDVTRSGSLGGRLPAGRRRRRGTRATCSPSTRPTRPRWSTSRSAPLRTRPGRHGQVLLLDRDGRAALAVPGTSFTADRVLDAVTRLAKAVGAAPASYSVRLRLGGG